MEIKFDDRALEALYSEGSGRLARKFPPQVIRAFFRVMTVVKAVGSAQELHRFRGLDYHSLVGKRSGQKSLRLNDQFRLVVIEEGDVLNVIEIVDYH
jgi:proteic killer suppression protein